MRRWVLSVLTLLLALTPGMPAWAQEKSQQVQLAHEMALAGQEGFAAPEPGAAARSLSSPDNAAPLYQQIAHTLGPQPGLSWYWPLSFFSQRTPLSAESLAAARTALKEHPDALDLAHRAARRPYCLVAVDPDPSQDGYVSLLPAMRAAARILCAESMALLADGRPEEAARPLVDCCHIARHIFLSNRLSDTVVGEEIEETALACLQRILSTAPPDARVSAAVVSACDAVQLPNMVYMLHRELAFAVLASNWNAAHPHNIHEGAGASPRLDLVALATERRESLLRIVRALRILQPTVQLPYLTARQKITAIILKLDPDEDADNYYDGYVLDMHRTALTAGAHVAAYREVVLAAAELLAYKARTGAFPATLEEAMPHPSVDPFAGGPLSYRGEVAGFVVFSKGATGRYDGAPAADRRARNEVFFRYTSVSLP